MWRTARIRFGLGRFNTQAEVDYVAAKVIDIVKKLRELSPLYEMVKEGIDLTKIQWAGALRHLQWSACLGSAQCIAAGLTARTWKLIS